MDAKKDQRKEERFGCQSSVKIAFYVPIEYEVFYETNCFTSTIVDYSENGFGIELGDKVNENTVVNIFQFEESASEDSKPLKKSYQSKILWTKKIDSQTFKAGVRHMQ